MSVSTIYPSIGYRFSRNHEQGGTWAQWWADTTCSGYGQDYNISCSVYHGDNDNSYDIYRYTLSFDTSSVPANATISAVVFNAYRKEEIDGGGAAPCYLDLCPVSATGNSAGYYNKAYFGTSLATLTGAPDNGSVNLWWQPSIATTSVTKAGTTILGLRHYCDYNNSAPGGTNITGRLTFYGYDNATYKPYLTVTWTTPSAVTTGLASSIEGTTATLAGNVTDIGGGTVSSRGACWSTSANPTTSNSKATSAGTTGAYTVSATSLTKNTLYHYRAYVITENSTQYGADATFTTDVEATIISVSVDRITSITARGNGNVTSDGNGTVTERGFCWNTTGTPVTTDNKVTSNSGTGVYSATMTGLLPSVKYYARAYAINGVGTSYGAELTFIPPSGAGVFFSTVI